MNSKIRTILLLIFTFLFLVLSPVVILYSQGYRFDWKTKTFSQTGAIYLKTWPKKTDFYLNHKFIGATDFLTGSYFQKGLLPGEYFIEIKKENYQPWKKTLEVKEKLVTEAKEIILVPTEIPSLNLSTGVLDFFVSPSKQKVLLIKEYPRKTILNEEEDKLSKREFFLEINSIDNKFTNLRQIVSFPVSLEITKINDIFWGPEEKRILARTAGGFYLFDFSRKKQSRLIFSENIIPLGFLSQDEFVYLDSKGFVVQYNLSTLTSKIIKANNVSCLLADNSFVCLDKEGFVKRFDKTGRVTEIFNTSPFALEKNIPDKLFFPENDKIFIKAGEKLWFLKSGGKFSKVTTGIRSLAISPDRKKIAILKNNKRISLFYFKKDYQQPIRPLYQEIPLLEADSKILNLFWYDPYHLILQETKGIFLGEIDTRDTLNLPKITFLKTKKAFWNINQKTLLVLELDTKTLLTFYGF